ncbi:DNA repair protein RadA [Desulfobacterales bacterium HSG17]|nr:DNA repair protein RadA [Desulfobacterales bacterium HSG17]
MKKSTKTVFTCQSCGYQTPKWMGKCPDCGTWESLSEEQAETENRYNTGNSGAFPTNRVQPLDEVVLDPEERRSTSINELDRVLGGGLVAGTLILIGGDPGIGKSTLVLQAFGGIAKAGGQVLYISGEESARQIRMRADRLNAVHSNIHVSAEIDMDQVLTTAEKMLPTAMVVDSIQTMFNSALPSAPGSVGQVREATLKLLMFAKRTGVPVFLVGHVTKEGAIAGPRIMEHMVDTVLYFEGDRHHVFRILRAVKNRFGSTNEIGVFEMKTKGLAEVPNPSGLFLSERPDLTSGSVVAASLEGSRPILVEVQALCTPTSFASPKRTIIGLDAGRVALLTAVMDKRLSIHLLGHDIFMNVAGGVRVNEPAVDLAVVAALAGSFLDKPVATKMLVMGEIGLAGEIRAVGHIENRMAEAVKMGFTDFVVPAGNAKRVKMAPGTQVIGVSNIRAAMDIIFSA